MFDDTRIKKYIYRLLSGKAYIKLGDEFIIYTPPCVDLLHQAEFFYEEKYFEGIKLGFMTFEDSIDFSVSKGWWSEKEDKNIEEYPKKIEEAKVDLFFAWQQKSSYSEKIFRKKIESLKKIYSKSLYKKNMLYGGTADYYAESYVRNWLYSQTLFDKDMNKIPIESTVFFNKVYNNIEDIPYDYYRKIARSSEWLNCWSSKDNDFFGKPASKLNKEQINIWNTSRMYDAVLSHPNCPEDEVLNDSDLFDGWMINNSNRNQAEIAKKEIDENLDRAGVKGGKVFVIAKDAEDAKKIHNMNSNANKMVVKNFMGTLNEKAKK